MSDQTIAAPEIEAFMANLPETLRVHAAVGGGTLHLSAAGCIALAARLDAVSRKLDDIEEVSERGVALIARIEAEKVAYFRNKFWNEIDVWIVLSFCWTNLATDAVRALRGIWP